MFDLPLFSPARNRHREVGLQPWADRRHGFFNLDDLDTGQTQLLPDGMEGVVSKPSTRER